MRCHVAPGTCGRFAVGLLDTVLAEDGQPGLDRRRGPARAAPSSRRRPAYLGRDRDRPARAGIGDPPEDASAGAATRGDQARIGLSRSG